MGLLRSLVVDEQGQDLVEYALLAALVALVTVPAIAKFQSVMYSTYVSWFTASMGCWQMPDPGHGGGC
jgi:Flp pilus assembly pilin Flp